MVNDVIVPAMHAPRGARCRESGRIGKFQVTSRRGGVSDTPSLFRE